MPSSPKLAPQYQFAAPKQNQGSRLWTINRINEPTPYLCLRAQLSQVLLNPFTLGLALLAVFVHISYLVAQTELQMLSTSSTDLCQLVASSTKEHSQSDFSPVLDSLNSSTRALAQLGLGSYATIFSNLGETSLRHYTRDVNSFLDLVESVPQSVNTGAKSDQDRVQDWLGPRLAKAQNMSSILLKAFSEVGAALNTSGIFSLSQDDVEDVFDITLPSFDEFRPGPVNFTLITDNTTDAVNQAVNRAAAQLNQVSLLPLNLGKINITQSNVTKCEALLQKYDEVQLACSRAKNASIAAYSLMALITIIMSCCMRYLNWRNMTVNTKTLKENVTGYETDGIIDPMEYFYDSNHFMTTKMKNICAKLFKKRMYQIYTQWAVGYLSTSTMNSWLLVSFWIMLLAIPTAVMQDRLDSTATKPDILAGTISIDFDAMGSSLNDQISRLESGINETPKRILVSLFDELNNILKNTHENLNEALHHYLSENSLDISVNTSFVPSMQRIAAPTISLPRVSAGALKRAYGSSNLLSISPEPTRLLSKICDVLWTTFGVMIAVWVIWTTAALVYTYYAAKITQKASGIFSTAKRIHKLVVSESKGEPVPRPPPAPPLPTRNVHRPNYFI